MADDARVWLVTGCGSGFGAKIAQQILDFGEQVAATDINAASLSHLTVDDDRRLFTAEMDVTSWESVQRGVEAVLARFDRIDVLVNNAGLGLGGPYEESDWPAIERVMSVNTLGVMAVTRAVLPWMREHARGRIINISSDSGQFGQPMQVAYSASKFAVEGFSEALAHEVDPLGISVSIVEPCGMFATPMPANAMTEAEQRTAPDSAYRRMVDALLNKAKAGMSEAQDPRIVVDAVIELADAPDPPLRVAVGPEDRLQVLHARHQMPDADFIRMIRQHLLD